MEFAFYVAGLVAILATLRVITHTNPVHALLYLIVSLLALSIVFFSVGSYFAGALEIIVYAGAIMVLFVFVVMMLNLGKSVVDQERAWLQPKAWIGPAILSAVLLSVIIYAIISIKHSQIKGQMISAKEVGMSLFGPYVLAVELISLLLIGLEIMINSAALAFVVAGSYWGQADGQVMYILTISLAAAEASIGLALLLQLHRHRQNLNIDEVSEMRG